MCSDTANGYYKRMRKTHSRPFQFPWREDNRFCLLNDGPAYFPQMLSAIESAKQFVLLEMYLVESGKLIQRFIDTILRSAQHGVHIYILFDDYGTIGLNQSQREQLNHKNIHLQFFNKLPSHNTLHNMLLIFLLKKEHGLFRNHRKLLLVDGETAFVGGTGLTDEFERQDEPEKSWRETMIMIQGPVILDWQQLFTDNWNRSTQQTISLPAANETMIAHKKSGNQTGRVTVNEIKQYSEVLISLNNHIYNAKKRVWFCSAYFVPGRRIRRRLKRSAKAGLDVRLLLPGPITDHPSVRHAGQRFYARLLKNGVRIYEYQPRFIHSKCVLCDDWVTIGSSNFDRWNLRWNLEANQEIEDKNFASDIKSMFIEDFENSVEITLENWQQSSWHLRLRRWFWKNIERLSQKIGN